MRTCVEFADALATRLQTVADESGATDATAVALPASGPRHQSGSRRAGIEPQKPQWKLVVAIVVALLLTVAVIALVLFAMHVI